MHQRSDDSRGVSSTLSGQDDRIAWSKFGNALGGIRSVSRILRGKMEWLVIILHHIHMCSREVTSSSSSSSCTTCVCAAEKSRHQTRHHRVPQMYVHQGILITKLATSPFIKGKTHTPGRGVFPQHVVAKSRHRIHKRGIIRANIKRETGAKWR